MPRPFARVARGSAIETPASRSKSTITRAVTPERTATAAATLAPWSNATRAAIWFAAKMLASSISSGMPMRGDRIALMGPELKA
jgi:hypothetical protein